MSSLKKLKHWIKQKAEKHNHINPVKFAEFPIDMDDESRVGVPTKWFAGLFMVKPNVKLNLLFSCRSGHDIIREDTFEYVTDARKYPIRTEVISLIDCAILSTQLATTVKETQAQIKKKRKG